MYWRVLLLMSIGFWWPSSTTAADRCVGYDQFVRWIGGRHDGANCAHIARKDDNVYAPNGPVLRTLDVSDPVRPITVNQFVLPSNVSLLRLSGNYLACATVSGTYLFDIHNPSIPTLIWQDDVSGRRGLAFSPGLFYRLTETDLEVYRLDEGGVPEFISAVAAPNCFNLVVEDGRAYTAQSFFLQCVDVSDPSQLSLRGTLNAGGTITGFAARGHRLYLTKYNSNISGGYLLTIDASDLDSLTLRSSIAMNCGWLSRIAMDEELLIVTSGNDLHNAGFVVVDLADPDIPVWRGRCDTVYAPHGLAIARPREITVGFNEGFGIFDLENLEFIHESDYEWANPDAWAIERRGNYLWVATPEGIAVWDASNPVHVIPVTDFNWDTEVRSLYDDGNQLFAGTAEDLVYTVSTAVPEHPVRIGSYVTPGTALSVHATQEWVAVACGTDGVALYERRSGWDLTPDAELLGTVEWGDVEPDARNVSISGSTLVVGDWNYGIVVFSIAPDGTLHLRSIHRDLAPVNALAMNGPYIYAAGGSDNFAYGRLRARQLHTLLLLPSGEAQALDTQQIPIGASSLKVAGERLYVGLTDFGVFSYSLAAPIPQLRGGAATLAPYGGWEVRDFCVGSDYIFTAATEAIRVLPADCDDAPVRLAAAPSTNGEVVSISVRPNPFNPRTSLSFSVSAAGIATVEIFDARGAVVTRLMDGVLAAGPQQIDWLGVDAAGRPVSSGTYFCRVTTVGGTETKKMQLVR